MKKVFAALVAAAFSLVIAGSAMAIPAQVSQQHHPIAQVQAEKADQTTTKKSKKKKAAKKAGKKKQTAKKAQKPAA